MIQPSFQMLNQKGTPMFYSDTFANRPTAGVVGRMFIATDTYAFYRDTGSGWDLIGGPGTGTITGSGAAGQVSFFSGASTIGGSNNLFWDSANNRLGIGTATPGVQLDIHTTGTGLSINGTTTNNSFATFQNAGTGKWRIGNNYSTGSNYFSIYDVLNSTERVKILNTGATTLTGTLTTSGSTTASQFIVGSPSDLTRSFAAGGNANDIALYLEEYGNTTASADIFFVKGRGTISSKSNISVGDSLGGFTLSGYVNGSINNSVIVGTVVTNINTTDKISDADFTIQQTNNSATLTENLRLTASGGNLTITGNITGKTATFNGGSSYQVLTINSTDANLSQMYFQLSGTTRGKTYLYYDGVSTYEMRIGTYIAGGQFRVETGNNTTALVIDGSQNSSFSGSITSTGNAATFSALNLNNNYYSTGAAQTKISFGLGNANPYILGTVDGANSGNGRLKFYTTLGGTNSLALTLNNDQSADFTSNIGINVSQSAWDTTQTRTIEIGTIGNYISGYLNSSVLYIGTNSYLSSGGWKYARTGSASTQIDTGGGNFNFLYAASGTAGNAITWSSAMKLVNNGNVLIGTTTDNGNKLQINGNTTINGELKYYDFITPSSNFFTVYTYNDSTWRINYNGAGGDELILSSAGVLTIRESYKSGSPNGGTAANWKFGSRVAAAVVLSTTQYIELDVNGTLYKLAIVT